MDEKVTADVALEELAAPQPPSLMRRIFRNRFDQWRAGWRMVLYLIAVGLVGFGLAVLMRALLPDPGDAPFISWRRSVPWIVGSVALVLGAFVVLRFFDRRPIAALGLGLSRGWLREVVGGLAAGLAATGVLVVILIVTGSVSLELAPNPAASLAVLPLLFFMFTWAGALEELVFRGYLMQALAEGSRRWIAAIVLCIPFTWGHADNPDVTGFGVANIFLAGVILAVLYFQTRRLWLPISFHLSWNLTQSWLWGFDVSGIKIEDQLFLVTQKGSDLVTGGEFGLEGSVLSTVLFVLLIGWLLIMKPLHPAPEVKALWAAYPAGWGLPPETAVEEEEQGNDGPGEQGSDGNEELGIRNEELGMRNEE
jgi:membrane protease YdiL (CAAX protease family)